MAEQPPEAVTQLLHAAGRGDPRAAAELLPLVYSELRELAKARMAKTPPGNTLQPTALVHEAYVRLVGQDDPGWNSRGHFFGAAAQAMRRILVEQARRKASVKHGAGRKRVRISGIEPVVDPPPDDLLELDNAITRLEEADPRQAQVVILRYFAGLPTEEIAAVLEVSKRTVERELRFARVLLFDILSSQDSDER